MTSLSPSRHRPAPSPRVASLLETVSTTSRSAVLVAGGYFDTAAGIGAFSLNSFALAQETGAVARRLHRGNKVLYDVIVNDLGMSCSTDVCTLPAAGSAETDLTPLNASAAEAGISFSVTRERNLRNRAARSMKRRLGEPGEHPLFAREGDEIVFRSRQYAKVLAGVVKDDHVVPRCPLIVAEYFARYFARLRAFPDCALRYVVDINSLADRDKVTKGAEIYLRTQGSPEEEIVLVFADATCAEPLALTYTAYDF
ncbi:MULTISPECIES: hypothetical protein [unclassified Streptomyces]|uniref:hypothetical protein n=1 Tax=unclassified Streptomyces TaxID=2593676 RepID=UPI000701F7E6|nr:MULTISPECIES: hypothetical protein [unclassified Streptomyces]KQX47353.1 hypothetical protein ASD33_21350 [Streptomyces sp. Root1304]KRA94660.1 hypothetical protein ASE09_30565 [Streptomyces sp. Root66D1]